MEIVKKKIDDLLPAPYNPRKDLKPKDAEYQKLKKSLQEFGYVEPVIFNSRTGFVVGGHQRLKVLKELGYTEVDAVVVDLEESQEKALNVALNKINGEWDEDKLRDLLNDLKYQDYDLTFTGFDLEELNDLNLEGLEDTKPRNKMLGEDSYDTTKDIPEKVKSGELWRLGEHLLYCGDSTKSEDVAVLMGNDLGDMVFTDPPYGVNVKGGKDKGILIEGDLTQTAIPFSFELAVLKCTKDLAHFYFCGSESNLMLYDKLFDRYLHMLPKHLIWVKNGFVMKQNGYHNQYEVIFHGYKKGAGALWFGGRKEDEASDVWHINRDNPNAYVHPTQKPVALAARAIQNSCPPNGIVVDLFGGSGSTLIACEQLGRKCRMMEMTEHYCNVIVNRWETLTGKEAEKIG